MYDNSIIEWDQQFEDVTITDFDRWIYDADVEATFPHHEAEFNKQFWSHPVPLYHATTEQNVQSILQYGLTPESKTRGIAGLVQQYSPRMILNPQKWGIMVIMYFKSIPKNEMNVSDAIRATRTRCSS